MCNPVSDRSARLKEMQERQEELESNNKRLQQEEQDMREKYHEVCTCVAGLFKVYLWLYGENSVQK